MIAFSGDRTHHRLFTGLEDAGWTIRRTITWIYGGSMPKGRDVGDDVDDDRFDGFQTDIKPATEFAALARAPIDEDTIGANLREHGTGGLNVDATRIEHESEADLAEVRAKNPGRDDRTGGSTAMRGGVPQQVVDESGRFPPNLILDERAADQLDAEVGDTSAGHWTGEDTTDFGAQRGYDGPGAYGGTGGPSRYFYCAKASTRERTLDGAIENDHPTVKPLDLMEWLVTLVTAEGQVVLDPFAGAGTTLMAAKELGREFVGIEIDEQYADIARARVGLEPADPSHVRPVDGDQSGLEAFTGGGEQA